MAVQLTSMHTLTKSLLVMLLILAQLAGPLVHAHVGGDAAPGKVHMPGLEMLTMQPEQAVAQSEQMLQEQPGTVVSIATGLQIKPIPCLSVVEWAFSLAQTPPHAIVLAATASTLNAPSPAHAPPRLMQTSPRAPPRMPII